MKVRMMVFVLPLFFVAAAPADSPADAGPAAEVKPPRRDAVRAYVEALRADLSNGKVKTINRIMKLSDEESKVFWSVYKDYEDELFAIGDKRLALLRDYAKLIATGGITEDKARELAPAWFEIQTQQLELLKKYHSILQEKLSPIRAAQFVQIEHRFGLVIDLSIASDLPLMDAKTETEARPAAATVVPVPTRP
jgi:hypothetical protein